MKHRLALLEQLKSQPYFEKRDLRQLGEPFGLKDSTISAYISRSIRGKDIIALRRGLYVTSEFYDGHRGDISYRFYLANILRRPSYISSWTALQYYNLATEVIHVLTSVSTKTTRDYRTKVGDFAYHSIKAEQFIGFTLEKHTFDFFIASPSKALFDLLYFRTRRFSKVSLDSIDYLIEDLRIDLDEMPEKERDSFYNLIRNYQAHE